MPSPYSLDPAGARYDAAEITPADSELARPAYQVWVGGAGDLAVVTQGGTAVTFAAVPAGTLLRIQCKQISATGTTATGIVAIY